MPKRTALGLLHSYPCHSLCRMQLWSLLVLFSIGAMIFPVAQLQQRGGRVSPPLPLLSVSCWVGRPSEEEKDILRLRGDEAIPPPLSYFCYAKGKWWHHRKTLVVQVLHIEQGFFTVGDGNFFSMLSQSLRFTPQDKFFL